MTRAVIFTTAWITALCALITWQDGVIRFIGLLFLCTALIGLMNDGDAA